MHTVTRRRQEATPHLTNVQGPPLLFYPLPDSSLQASFARSALFICLPIVAFTILDAFGRARNVAEAWEE